MPMYTAAFVLLRLLQYLPIWHCTSTDIHINIIYFPLFDVHEGFP